MKREFRYEFYYDALRGGKYLWKVEQMHSKYVSLFPPIPR
jgi:hypothetical protein